MEILPETVRKVWNDWELRGLVLLSLTLQIILIILGNRRKYAGSARVSAVLWVTYLSADWIAAVALGVLCNGQGDEDPSSSYNSGAAGIKAFWAPILLVHLGGPDTITAYSVEDSELWTRHFLGAVVQVGVAFYVFLRSWTSETSNLLVLSVPVFVAGIIKYGERTWALRSASYDHFYSHFLKFSPLPTVEGFHVSNEEDIYRIAFSWFVVSKAICRDNSYSRDGTVSYARSSIGDASAEEAFGVIEVELGFMFDALFTKASVIWSSSGSAGCILRLSAFICSVGALVAFTLTHKHGCPTIDVVISYVLLAGAVTLEIYAMVLLFFSDWAVVWLTDPEWRSARWNRIYGTLATFVLAVNNYCWGRQRKKRWCRKVGQFNLISSCITNRRLADKGLMRRLWNKLHEEPRQVDVSAELIELIFKHVKDMAINPDPKAIKPGSEAEVDLQSRQNGMGAAVGGPQTQVVDLESGMLTDAIHGHDERSHPDPAEVDIQHSEMPSLAKRVEGLMPPRPDELLATLIINRDLPQQYIRKELEKSDFRELILVFHIATDLCIPYSEAECSEADPHLHRKTTELLSNYMVYLLAKLPTMLPGRIGKHSWYEITRDRTSHLVNNNNNLQNFRDEGEVRRELHKQIRESRDDKSGKSSSLGMGSGLAVEMGKLGTEKWERICGAWVEMLCFAAKNCEWRSGHAPQLGRGGELLTHVHFLMMATTAFLLKFNANHPPLRHKAITHNIFLFPYTMKKK